MAFAALVTALLLALGVCQAAFYLPGVTPNVFQEGETVSWRLPFADDASLSNDRSPQVSLKANKVISTKTPLQYDYYDLPFCKRRKTKSKAENLGERLTGDTVTNSPYEVRFCT
jgi:transmembrane 9 superfamily protein 2/4